MRSGSRIRIALVGLVLLAVVGWLVTDLTHRSGDGDQPPSRPAVTSTVPPSPAHPAGVLGPKPTPPPTVHPSSS